MIDSIAQTDLPSADWSRNAVLAVSLILNLAMAYVAVFGRRKVDVAMEEKYATRDEVDELGERVDALEEDTRSRLESAAKASSESRAKLYESIRALEQRTAAVAALVDTQLSRQAVLDQKLDRVLERIAARN